MTMKKAFTLIEVNLAMLVMAGGVLSAVGLYSFGYRENTQSREDVASAALADAVMSPLIAAIGATNSTWSSFRSIKSFPSDEGWKAYLDSNGIVSQDPQAKAQSVFDGALGAYKGAVKGTLNIDGQFPQLTGLGMSCGLIVLHEQDSPVVRIGFRATPTPGQLLAMPQYFTEVRFQGVVDQ